MRPQVERDHGRMARRAAARLHRRRSCRRRRARRRAIAVRSSSSTARTCSRSGGKGRPRRGAAPVRRRAAHKVGIALAGRVKDALGVIVAEDASRADDRAQRGERRLLEPRGLDCDLRELDRRAGARLRSRRRRGSRVRAPAAPADAPDRPIPTSAFGLAQPLIRSRPSSAPSSVAGARAANHPCADAREDAAQSLAKLDRHVRLLSNGLQSDLRDGAAKHAREGRSRDLLLPAEQAL